MKKSTRAEFWEIQLWLMWILDAILFSTGHPILGAALFVYSLIALLATVFLEKEAEQEEGE